jgi:MYXO-CTERM domain-containing protein
MAHHRTIAGGQGRSARQVADDAAGAWIVATWTLAVLGMLAAWRAAVG